MVYYASTIFQALGFQSGDKATLASLGIGIAKVSSQHLYVILGDPGAVNRGAREKIGGTKGCTNTDVLAKLPYNVSSRRFYPRASINCPWVSEDDYTSPSFLR